ncbi:MAG TPA: SPFH domain-containing protein, partial [Candidatus Paceibacterota bacterium]|nr:SPFH domain-containing protein [Candidatus Paceibacterota bacterium]
GPGFYFCWWFIQQIDVYNTLSTAIETQVITATTADGKVVCISWSMSIHVEDPIKHLGVYDLYESARSFAATYTVEGIRHYRLEDLLRNPHRLVRSQKIRLARKLSEWGVVLDNVGITSFVPMERRIFCYQGSESHHTHLST